MNAKERYDLIKRNVKEIVIEEGKYGYSTFWKIIKMLEREGFKEDSESENYAPIGEHEAEIWSDYEDFMTIGFRDYSEGITNGSVYIDIDWKKRTYKIF